MSDRTAADGLDLGEVLPSRLVERGAALLFEVGLQLHRRSQTARHYLAAGRRAGKFDDLPQILIAQVRRETLRPQRRGLRGVRCRPGGDGKAVRGRVEFFPLLRIHARELLGKLTLDALNAAVRRSEGLGVRTVDHALHVGVARQLGQALLTRRRATPTWRA